MFRRLGSKDTSLIAALPLPFLLPLTAVTTLYKVRWGLGDSAHARLSVSIDPLINLIGQSICLHTQSVSFYVTLINQHVFDIAAAAVM